ncbi:MAG: hypothetical protein GY762_22575, partial [Proteobacteria bacterium]|nr:hypothetical protein [Pseudomonadota bacterium]
LLYVGTDCGVYVTLDDGKNWQVLGSNLPVTFVHDLALQERENGLVTATHGRGMPTPRLRPLHRAYDKLYPNEEEEASSDEENQDEQPRRRRRSQADDDKDG